MWSTSTMMIWLLNAANTSCDSEHLGCLDGKGYIGYQTYCKNKFISMEALILETRDIYVTSGLGPLRITSLLQEFPSWY